jgi:TolB-like protein/class 3 adenylate cyclase
LSSEQAERRLAAILAADVAGSCRLIGIDEEGTVAQLRALRTTLFDPKIAEHHGRVVKNTGDGALVEFGSVVDAVRCANEIQRGMAEQNVDVPQDKRIEFRIGIHVGDIIITDDDIFGDGVNIAVRLEGIAEPGGVCISDDAHRQVRGKVEIACVSMGPQLLKNITEPMQAWQVRLSGQSTSAIPSGPALSQRQALPLPDKPSIAVLPFQNMSGDPEQDYFADGMVEDIITALSRLHSFFVIARNSTFAYKGLSPDIRQVGRELGVRYVLEGSVRKSGNRVRIVAQLIDVVNGSNLWAERYDRELADIFVVQDEITESVVGSIEPQLYIAEGFRSRCVGMCHTGSFALCPIHRARLPCGSGLTGASHRTRSEICTCARLACPRQRCPRFQRLGRKRNVGLSRRDGHGPKGGGARPRRSMGSYGPRIPRNSDASTRGRHRKPVQSC